ncbi:MAG: FtsQ-type POTRA domain-containing protein [Proteobacteria bacterium]|nr:FtsQ-type POTRA domain-containing protein [Pseudomonadota bacterium]
MAARTSKFPIRRPRASASTRKAFLLTVFCVAQVVFFTSDMFRVRAVEVVGNDRLSDATIRAQAAVSLQGPLFSVPLRNVEERVHTLHWVKDAAVRRYMPGRIQIRVHERTPALAVADPLRAGTFPTGWFVMSDDGMVLAPAGARGEDSLPRVLVSTPLLVGHRLSSTLVSTVRETLAAIPPEMTASVRELRADAQGQLFLSIDLLDRPIEVRLGGAERAPYKFAVLQALTGRLALEERPVSYIDLRYNDPAVGYMLVQAETATKEEKQQ